MSSSKESPDAQDGVPPSDNASEPEGCGPWIPAAIAIGLLVLMVGFVTCAGSTYWLFQQRGEIALGTLEGTLVPLLEQSKLQPDEKQDVLMALGQFAERGRAGEFENWQIAGVMQRLVRAPVISWGDLQAIELMIQNSSTLSDAEKQDASMQISRVMRGAELDTVTQFAMLDLLEPVSDQAENEMGYALKSAPSDDEFRAFVRRCKGLADGSKVSNKSFDVKLLDIVQRQIDAGIESGMK